MNVQNQISKNFTFDEFTLGQIAIEHSILNQPDENEATAIIALVTELLQPLRDLAGEPIAITSGYRSEEVNRLAGGVANSQHRLGEAADCYTASGPERLLETLLASNLDFVQAIVYRHRNILHLSFRSSGKNRREVIR